MSDQFYAVEVRNMHTAIHEIFVFSLESVAHDFYDMVFDYEIIPESFEFEEGNFVGRQEIDYRRKPYEFGEMEILYINEWDKNNGFVPDVYGI